MHLADLAAVELYAHPGVVSGRDGTQRSEAAEQGDWQAHGICSDEKPSIADTMRLFRFRKMR